jgi:hypothetical protein
MNIEFQTPHGQVNEWLISFIRDKILEFHHLDKNISKAQVCLSEQAGGETGAKKCEIELTVFGDSIFVHKTAVSYEEAAFEAVNELNARIEEVARKNNEPPDEITSSVKV